MDDALTAVNNNVNNVNNVGNNVNNVNNVGNIGNVASATTSTTAAIAAAANRTATDAAVRLLPVLSPFFFVGFFLDVLFALDFIFRMQVNKLYRCDTCTACSVYVCVCVECMGELWTLCIVVKCVVGRSASC